MLPMKVAVVRSSEPGCEPNCPEWIQAEGEIKPGSAAEFRKVLKQIGKRKLPVIIRSPGGSLDTALEIGRMVRKRGLAVAVGFTLYETCGPHDKDCKLPKEQKGVYRDKLMDYSAFCTSACPFILAAGSERIASAATYVGVHQVRTNWVQQRIYYREKYRIVKGKKKVIERKEVSRKTVKRYEKFGLDKGLRKKLTAYLGEMEVGRGMLEDMEKASPSDMYRLPAERLKELRLITAGTPVTAWLKTRRCSGQESSEGCNEEVQAARLPPTTLPSGDKLHEKLGIGPSEKPMVVARVRFPASQCEPLCPEWIAASGFITKESPAHFAAFLDDAVRLHLPFVISSPGGDIEAALDIAQMLRENVAGVYVAETDFLGCNPRSGTCAATEKAPLRGLLRNSGQCNGACLLVLAGGVTRSANGWMTNARVYPLSHYTTATNHDSTASKLRLFLNGIAQDELLKRMTDGAGAGPSVLNYSELRSLGIIGTSALPSELINGSTCTKSGHASYCIRR